MLRMASILHAIEESMPELAGVEVAPELTQGLSSDSVQLIIEDDAELDSDLVNLIILGMRVSIHTHSPPLCPSFCT